MKTFSSHLNDEHMTCFNATWAPEQASHSPVAAPRWSRAQASLAMVSALFLLGACSQDASDSMNGQIEPPAASTAVPDGEQAVDPAMPEVGAPAMPGPDMPEAAPIPEAASGASGATDGMSPPLPEIVPQVAPQAGPVQP